MSKIIANKSTAEQIIHDMCDTMSYSIKYPVIPYILKAMEAYATQQTQALESRVKVLEDALNVINRILSGTETYMDSDDICLIINNALNPNTK